MEDKVLKQRGRVRQCHPDNEAIKAGATETSLEFMHVSTIGMWMKQNITYQTKTTCNIK